MKLVSWNVNGLAACKRKGFLKSIARLRADAVSGPAWDRFRRFHTIRTAAGERPEGGFWVRVNAKRRWIDPLAVGRGRVSAWSPAFREARTSFLSLDFTRWLSAE